jgi:hypothetical protein
MTQKIVLTSDWSLEEIMPYSPQITAALKKLKDRFPEDGTMESMAQDIMNGAIHLWLALDDEEFRGVVLTTIKTIEATGYRALLVVGAAGDDGIEFTNQLQTIEDWAKDQGLNSCQPVGRIGWKKPLSTLGYEIDRVVYRKAL